ncbi:hypothetical protein [Bradyrhizobium sp. CB1015]|uniref:hypothetical protein n=1 Tax=Bradyrhizobium sp. CB1015 TaxID=2976822 RepID=UPI0021A9DF45|nr:hypothetical protein [Bradyrhizobium sp. CB1015]UWU95136.1 hypothetical protein N2604_15310 [Bradyrhizobium sp. CB1015]
MASAAAKRTRLFEKPIRLYSPEELGLLHRSAAQITAELRSETGRAQYLKLYSDYLRTDTGCMSLLRNSGSPFASHLGTRLYAVDVKNQFGSGSWLVRKARNSWSADQSDEQAFQAMLREVRENTKQGREHLSDVIRRQDNLKRVLTLFDASISGGSPTDCNAKF